VTTRNHVFERTNPSSARAMILRTINPARQCALTELAAGNLPGLLQMAVRVRIPSERGQPVSVSVQTSRGPSSLDACVRASLEQLPWPRMAREESLVTFVIRFHRG
jgi:hypothetical protein